MSETAPQTVSETTDTTTRYVVQVCEDSDQKWLYLSMRDGTRTHVNYESDAKQFLEPPSLEEIAKFDNKPFWPTHDPDVAPRITKIIRTVTVIREEVK